MENKPIASIQELIDRVENDFQQWNSGTKPWFRGEPLLTQTPLLPKLFRKNYNEKRLLQIFRSRAPLHVDIQIPQRGQIDQWLFLAQHVGLPTRLLDWTEGLLVALYFALDYGKNNGSVVWMLEPGRLNELTTGEDSSQIDYSIPWFTPETDSTSWIHRLLEPDYRARKQKSSNINFESRFFNKIRNPRNMKYNISSFNIRAAWESDPKLGTEIPVAVYPTYIHPRINDQLGRFTIWGKSKKGLVELVGTSVLRKYVIEGNEYEKMKSSLRLLGISKSSLFNDLDSLAFDIQDM